MDQLVIHVTAFVCAPVAGSSPVECAPDSWPALSFFVWCSSCFASCFRCLRCRKHQPQAGRHGGTPAEASRLESEIRGLTGNLPSSPGTESVSSSARKQRPRRLRLRLRRPLHRRCRIEYQLKRTGRNCAPSGNPRDCEKTPTPKKPAPPPLPLPQRIGNNSWAPDCSPGLAVSPCSSGRLLR